MTYDTERTPRMPTESPEDVQQPGRPPVTPDRTAAGRTDTAPDGIRPERTPSPTAPAGATAPGTTPRGAPASHRPLIPEGEQEKLTLRLQHAVTEFVESPRQAVGEAESAFDAAVEGLASALKEHRHELNSQQQDGESETRTEELRVTLQHYRDLTERLLNV
ncbi:hypothetical protein ACFVW8_36630 [Streptomyces sp. NPDC058221]|uniref:hypothetical protein n=1 Tax=Streptomyces sp. NPDC058221 TaxID=3346388 RepID=UPI0036EBB195